MATPWRRRWPGPGCLPGRRRRSCWSGWRNRHRKRPPGGKPSPFYRWETGDRAEPVWFGPVSDYGDGEGEAWPAAPPPASSSSGGAAGSSVELSGSSGWEGSAGTLGSTGSVGCSGSPGKRGALPQGEPPPPEALCGRGRCSRRGGRTGGSMGLGSGTAPQSGSGAQWTAR